ncbi:hypothetical protein OH76DRAFT_1404292 [Lentinus brumalis]|uniref:Uncharacterized protein n=1 Tax=Lentinus brumalis TaxID=2498619 RepID=A0A371D877_9APHY|nr:hypothetical protein OH76DRAFT_1404292 [Polyporus brumalis]
MTIYGQLPSDAVPARLCPLLSVLDDDDGGGDDNDNHDDHRDDCIDDQIDDEYSLRPLACSKPRISSRD